MISYRGTGWLSKFKSPHLKIPKSKSPHFFDASHFISPISPHYKPHENDQVQILRVIRILSVFFLCFLHVFSEFFSTPHFLHICYAEIRKKLRRKCGTPQRMQRSEVWDTLNDFIEPNFLTPTFCIAAIFGNIALQQLVVNSWANLQCSGCLPLGEKLLWNRPLWDRVILEWALHSSTDSHTHLLQHQEYTHGLADGSGQALLQLN